MTNNWKDGPPKQILLATDLSARCDRALDRATWLAKLWGAKLVVAHVMEPKAAALLGGREDVPSWRMRDDPQERAEQRVRSEIREALPDVSVVIEHGDPADAILRIAQARGTDLIVTGVARDEPIGRFVLGSTVEKLLGRSPCPLLVVRKRGLRPYRHVVTATDFSDPSRQALEAALRLFPEAEHGVFHAFDAPLSGLVTDAASHRQQFRDVAAKECRAFLAASDLSALGARQPHVVLEHGQAEQLLFEYAEEKDVDLVVMGTHGRGAVYEIFIGSVAKRLVMALPCDALLIRPRQAVPAAT